jgi:hypothetical protein
MRFCEIAQQVRRDRFQDTHPVLFRLRVPAARWEQFLRAMHNYESAKLIARYGDFGTRIAVVACWDDEVGRSLAARWMT